MTRRAARQQKIVARRVPDALFAGLVVAVAATGCSAITLTPSLEDELHERLAQRVEAAQDELWPFRGPLATDPEATLPQIWSISDARPAYGDPEFAIRDAKYTLLGVSSSPEETTLTLATSAHVSSGGGWFYQSDSAAVCFTLRFPTIEKAIYTDSSDCSDGHGRGLRDVPDFDWHGDSIPLDELTARRTVTESDFQPLPCQCHSGGDCNCPGG